MKYLTCLASEDPPDVRPTRWKSIRALNQMTERNSQAFVVLWEHNKNTTGSKISSRST